MSTYIIYWHSSVAGYRRRHKPEQYNLETGLRCGDHMIALWYVTLYIPCQSLSHPGRSPPTTEREQHHDRMLLSRSNLAVTKDWSTEYWSLKMCYLSIIDPKLFHPQTVSCGATHWRHTPRKWALSIVIVAPSALIWGLHENLYAPSQDRINDLGLQLVAAGNVDVNMHAARWVHFTVQCCRSGRPDPLSLKNVLLCQCA